MKKIFRFFVTIVLALKARWILKKYQTQVIAVTGSVGKTSTKEAMYHILGKHFRVQPTGQGFNTPLGISLAILGEKESGFSSFRLWYGILKRALFGKREIYEKIILEMGADRPGDLKRLLWIAKPTMAVVTAINPVHLDKGQFKDLDAIAKEKGTLVRALSKEGIAILNFDDPRVSIMQTSSQKITFGMGEGADLVAQDVVPSNKNLKFRVTYKDSSASFIVPVLGRFQIYVLLPAIAVGLQMGLTLKQCAEDLGDFRLPKGRMNPIAGIKNSMIIDGSYNASPNSMIKSLELLKELEGARKITALGTMNELGDKTKEAHLALGAQASQAADLIIAIGPEAAAIKQGSVEAGMPEAKVYTFFSSEEGGHFLKDQIQEGDLILVKGSQNRVRMEKLVKIIMEHPEQASVLLCRQEKAWETI